MAERKSLSKKLRYEVLKRDKFTCQYCGRMSPDVILEVDHIKPVAKGGTDDLINLITSCRDCNRGKGKTPLSDDTALKKQQASLKELAEKREQMALMVQWKKELLDHKSEEVEYINEYVQSLTGLSLSEYGKKKAMGLLKQFAFSEILDAIEIAIDQYYDEEDGMSFTYAFNKVGGICYNKWHKPQQEREDGNL